MFLHGNLLTLFSLFCRFQENPTRDWGPKARAKRAGQETLDELRSKGQEKAKSKRQKKDVSGIFFKC